MPKEEGKKLSSEDNTFESVEKLRNILAENEKLCILGHCDEDYLKRFLYSTDFVVERAFEKIKLFYDQLEESPHWFTVENPTKKKHQIEQDIRLLTNIHDNEGRPVYIVKIGNMNASSMSLSGDVVPVDDFFIELLMLTDLAYQYGLCVILDISNFQMNLLKWLTPSNIKTALKRLQSMPLKEYKFHVVNSSRILNLAVNIIWPFLPRHIKEGIYFHFEDWDSLHKHIKKEILPEEFGGCGKMDYSKLRDQVYKYDVEIATSFKVNRKAYLKHIKKY